MKKLIPIVLFFTALNILTPQAQGSPNEGNTRGSVSLKMLSFTFPKYLTDTLHDQVGIPVPDVLSYGLMRTPLLGYAYTGEWQTLGVLLPLSAFLSFSASTLKESEDNWYARQILSMAASHSVWVSTYDIYQKLRVQAESKTYVYSFQPVNTVDALVSPFRFDYLADPNVSIGVGCSFLAAAATVLLSGNNFSVPTGSSVTHHGKTYPAAQGLALYWTEAAYRSYWAGVAEEAFFRGYLLPELIEYTGPITGIGLNSLLFTLGHYSSGREIPPLIGILAVSVYFSILSYQNDFDFRKSAFVHSWYDVFLSALYLFSQTSISFADIGSKSNESISFSPGIEIKQGNSISFSISLSIK